MNRAALLMSMLTTVNELKALLEREVGVGPTKSSGGGESRPAPEGSIFSRATTTQTPSPGQTEGAAGCELESGGIATGAKPSTVEPHEPADQQKADGGGARMQAGVAPGPLDAIQLARARRAVARVTGR